MFDHNVNLDGNVIAASVRPREWMLSEFITLLASLAVRRARADTCSKRGWHISQMRAVDVRDIANQFSLGRIAPTTSFVKRDNLIFCAATSKRASLVAMFQITINQSFERPRPDGVAFLT
jgi:hypothetical protein